MNSRKLSCCLILLLASVGVAEAQTPTTVSLDQAIHLAIAHNHALLAARSQIQQSQAQEITANLRPNPVLSWDSQFVPLFQPSQFSSDYFNNTAQFDLGVGYLIERGKKRQHRLQAARDQTAITKWQVADAERQLTFNVAQQFIAVLLAESTQRLAENDLASYQKTVQISEDRYKAGGLSEGDLLKVKLQMLQFQSDVSAAKLAKVQALSGLRQLVGYDALPAHFDVVGDLAYKPVKVNLDDLKMAALKDRPDLRAATAGVQGADSQFSLAKADGKRDLNASFNYSHVSGVNTGAFFFNMEMPIFDRNQGEIARTKFGIDQAHQLADAASDAVLTDVESAYAAVQSNDQVVSLYESGYVQQAKESRDISEYAFKRGAASLLDLLDAERSYRSTELAYRQALASYMIAVEQLKEAVGTRSLP